MRRIATLVAVTVTVGAAAAQPAGAARIYGSQPTSGNPTLLALTVSNTGAQLTKLTFHIDVSCGSDFRSVDSGTTLLVDTAPDRLIYGKHYLVGGKVTGGKFSGTIIGVDGNDTRTDLMDAAISGTVGKAKASGRLAVNFIRVSATDGSQLGQCSQTFAWSAVRAPGVLYAGATSQDEPIVLELKANRKSVSHAHLAWWAPCKNGGGLALPHDEFDLRPFTLSKTGSFKRTYTWNLGSGSSAIQRFAGKVGRTKASGTFQTDTTLAGTSGTNTCATGKVAWTAATG